MIPAEMFVKIKNGKYGKYAQRDDLLRHFQLRDGKIAAADAVGGHLQAIFKKRNTPADDNYRPQSGAFVFEMPVPSDGHKQVGEN